MTDKSLLKKAKILFENSAYGFINRKKKEWLIYQLKIGDRELRFLMHDLRKDGLMVMPDNTGGYFVVNTEVDHDCKLGIKFMNSEKNRGLHCLENAKPFKQLLPEGQIKIDFDTDRKIKNFLQECLIWCEK